MVPGIVVIRDRWADSWVGERWQNECTGGWVGGEVTGQEDGKMERGEEERQNPQYFHFIMPPPV